MLCECVWVCCKSLCVPACFLVRFSQQSCLSSQQFTRTSSHNSLKVVAWRRTWFPVQINGTAWTPKLLLNKPTLHKHTEACITVSIILACRFSFSPSLLVSLSPVFSTPSNRVERRHLQFLQHQYLKCKDRRSQLCGAPSLMQVCDFAVAQGHSHNVIQLPGVGVPVPAGAAQRHIAPT